MKSTIEARQGRILTAGAINTDLVGKMMRAPRAGETIAGTEFAVFGGGKAANQAVAAARSGSLVKLVGAVGDDQFGQDRLRDLMQEGIDLSGVATVAGEVSGVALIFVESTGENRIAFFPGATSRIGRDDLLTAYEQFQPDLVLAPNELPAEWLVPLFEAAQRDGVVRVFNATPDPASARDVLSCISILVVNEHEAIELLGAGEGGHAETARRLSERINRAVVITAGAEGVYMWDGAQGHHIRGPVRHAVDTTGAGDTFAGSFASELARGRSLTAAARYGVHASGISVIRAGAQSSIPRREEILASMAREAGA